MNGLSLISKAIALKLLFENWLSGLLCIVYGRRAIIHSRKIKTEEQNVKDIKRDISKAEWRAKVEQLTQSLTEYCVVNGALTLLLCVKSHFRLSVLAAVMLRVYCIVA